MGVPSREQKSYPAGVGETRWIRVPVSEIDYVRSIYEAYDGLAMLTAPSPDRGELSLWIADGLDDLADEIEARLTREVGLQRIAAPPVDG
jgi:hypothetical protein